MKTCLTFFEGNFKDIILKITVDEHFEEKVRLLKNKNEYVCDKLFDNYCIYHNPFPYKSKIQNSVFHNYNGHVFVSHKTRDLNVHDLAIFKEYTYNVLRKGKRIA